MSRRAELGQDVVLNGSPGSKVRERAPYLWIFGVLACVPLMLGAGFIISDGDSAVSDSDPPASATGVNKLGTIVGVVTTPDGRPVAGANVQVLSLEDPPAAVPDMGVQTGPAGRYQWPVRPGRYRVSVTAGSATATKTTTADAGRSVVLDFTLSIAK